MRVFVANVIKPRQAGFTLIELLVVILIVGILIAIAAPSFLGQTQKAHDSATKQYLTVAYQEAAASATDRGGDFTTSTAPVFDAAALALAIHTSEPGLTVTATTGTDSCPSVALDQPDTNIYIDSAGTHGNFLTMCADPDGRVWTLKVENGALQPFPQEPATSSGSPVIITPALSSAPVLSGSAQVGQTLTSSSGSWSSCPGCSYLYTFERTNADGSIVYATDQAASSSPAYAVRSADLNHYILVSVQASNTTGGTAVFATNVLGPVMAEMPSNSGPGTAAPSLSGTAVVGQTLTASPGTWTNCSGCSYLYTFERTNVDGSVVYATDQASSSSTVYTLVSTDLGKYIKVTVQATNGNGGTASAFSSNIPGPVVAESPSISGSLSPSLSGTTVVGQTLTADPGTWLNCAGCSYAYTFERTNADGSIVLATDQAASSDATYVVTSGDLNDYIRVTVQATNGNGGTASAFSSNIPGPVVAETPVNTGAGTVAPSISGTAVVDEILTAAHGTWLNCSGCSYNYTFERTNVDGSVVYATDQVASSSATYTLVTSGDLNDYIRVTVQATNGNGGTASTFASNIPGPVVAETPGNTAEPTITGPAIVGQTLSSSTGSWINC